MPGFFNNETGLYEDVEWLSNGQWLEDEEGFLYIVPKGVAEIEGPDNAMLDSITVAQMNTGEVLDSDIDRLGLVEIPEHLKRFSEADGYFHA